MKILSIVKMQIYLFFELDLHFFYGKNSGLFSFEAAYDVVHACPDYMKKGEMIK